MTDLKPCPFCGHDIARVYPANRNDPHRIYPLIWCMGCFTDVPGKNDDYSEAGVSAIAAWNRRAEAPEAQALIEAAVKAERERCAKVAERYANDHDPQDNETQFFLHEKAKTIAAAIRSQP